MFTLRHPLYDKRNHHKSVHKSAGVDGFTPAAEEEPRSNYRLFFRRHFLKIKRTRNFKL